MVALIQTAATLPTFLLALPSGAVADRVDRRRWLLATQIWVSIAGALLSIASWSGAMAPNVLLILVFINGVGIALRWPVLSAIVPEVVPPPLLPQALALNSVAINAARIVGPAVAGLLLASLGTAFVFAANAVLSFCALLMLTAWRSTRSVEERPPERFVRAMGSGLRHMIGTPALRIVLARAFVFFMHACALLALLPLISKELKGGAGTYTALMSCMGLGAILSGLSMTSMRNRFEATAVVNFGAALSLACTSIVAMAPNVWTVGLVMVPAGAAWIAVANTLMVRAQLVLPDWIRARGMAIFAMAAMGGNAVGAAWWGWVARHTDISSSLLLCAVSALALLFVGRRHRI